MSVVQFEAHEIEWLGQIQQRSGISPGHNEYSHEFNLLRWCYAYEGDLDLAAKKLRRHLTIRRILSLDDIHSMNEEHGIDEQADFYAPMTFIGNAHKDDGRPVFLEQSGLFDLGAMMNQIRVTPFMMNRFRQMERILKQVRDNEAKTGKMSGAVLIVDLQGLKFQSNLISFITGTYRIMWGTLMEQYPYMFSKFIVINAPIFMNVLWSACSSFIPNEYRVRLRVSDANCYLQSKIHVLCTTGEDYSKLHEHIDRSHLPAEYGGSADIKYTTPAKCEKPAITPPDNNLMRVSIPAGGHTVHTFFLMKDQVFEFYMQHTQEFTMNIFHSQEKKFVDNPRKDVEEMEEVFAGCERPALPTMDCWRWQTPYTGFYHIVYGNEKAWLMSVTLEYQLFEVQSNGYKVKVSPIKQ